MHDLSKFRKFAKNGLNPKAHVTTWLRKTEHREMIFHTGTFQLVLMFVESRIAKNLRNSRFYIWNSKVGTKLAYSATLLANFNICQNILCKNRELPTRFFILWKFQQIQSNSSGSHNWWTLCSILCEIQDIILLVIK
jgi:hypothetical protein